ncbi:Homeodomain-interacting protein kinase 3, partial [Clarias magur]
DIEDQLTAAQNKYNSVLPCPLMSHRMTCSKKQETNGNVKSKGLFTLVFVFSH